MGGTQAARPTPTFRVGGNGSVAAPVVPAMAVPDDPTHLPPIADIGPRTPPDPKPTRNRTPTGLSDVARERILRHAERQEEGVEPTTQEGEEPESEWTDDQIIQGLIRAGEDLESRREEVPIIRKVGGVPRRFALLTFRALREEENEACMNRSADQTQNPRTLQMERGELRVWEYKCRVIYTATLGAAGRKYWDNPELRASLGVRDVWHVIDRVLSINEKNMCIDAIDRISETQIALAEPTKSGD